MLCVSQQCTVADAVQIALGGLSGYDLPLQLLLRPSPEQVSLCCSSHTWLVTLHASLARYTS